MGRDGQECDFIIAATTIPRGREEGVETEARVEEGQGRLELCAEHSGRRSLAGDGVDGKCACSGTRERPAER